MEPPTRSTINLSIRIGLSLLIVVVFVRLLMWSDDLLAGREDEIEQTFDLTSTLATALIPLLLVLWILPPIVRSMIANNKPKSDTSSITSTTQKKKNACPVPAIVITPLIGGCIVIIGGLLASREATTHVDSLPSNPDPSVIKVWASANIAIGMVEVVGALMVITGAVFLWMNRTSRR